MLVNFLKKNIIEIYLISILCLIYSKSLSGWVKEWTNFESYYGLGFFVIVFNLYFVKENRDYLKNIPKSNSLWGIFFVLLAMCTLVIGYRGDVEYLVNLSFPLAISGIVLTLYGIDILKCFSLPIVLTAFILPIIPSNRLTIPLQMISTDISSSLLAISGINTFTEGNIIYANNFKLGVVAGCSGLKSLFSLVFVCLITCYFEKIKIKKKLFYLILIIPFAVSMNAIRIFFTVLYGIYNGYNNVEQFHDNLGLVMNVISILFVIYFIRYNSKKNLRSYEI